MILSYLALERPLSTLCLIVVLAPIGHRTESKSLRPVMAQLSFDFCHVIDFVGGRISSGPDWLVILDSEVNTGDGVFTR